MALPVLSFPIIKQQTNPIMDRISQGLQLAFQPNALQQESTKNNLANKLAAINLKYAQPNQEADLKSKLMANILAEINNRYVPREKESKIALTNAQIPLLGSKALLNQLNYNYPGLKSSGLLGALSNAQLMEDRSGGQQGQQSTQSSQSSRGQTAAYKLPINSHQKNILTKLFGAQRMDNLPNPDTGQLDSDNFPSYLQQSIQQTAQPQQQSNAPRGIDAANLLIRNAYSNLENKESSTKVNIAKASSLNPEIKASMAAVIEKQKSDIKNYSDALNSATNDEYLSKNIIKQAKIFHNAYQNANLKGKLLGKFEPEGVLSLFSNQYDQITDQAQANIRQLLASSFKGNRLTNQMLDFTKQLKVSRTLTPSAEQHLAGNIIAFSTRASELAPFLRKAQEKGISLNKAYDLWDKYNDDFPPIDLKELLPNKQHRDTWKAYLKPEKQRLINITLLKNKINSYDKKSLSELKQIENNYVR